MPTFPPSSRPFATGRDRIEHFAEFEGLAHQMHARAIEHSERYASGTSCSEHQRRARTRARLNASQVLVKHAPERGKVDDGRVVRHRERGDGLGALPNDPNDRPARHERRLEERDDGFVVFHDEDLPAGEGGRDASR